jgi:autotransporter strand-loop-strand O-heptosyltransferase
MLDVNFKVDYVVTNPLEGHNPKVTIFGNPNNTEVFHVLFIDKNTNELIFSGDCAINNTIIGSRQWHIDWLIHVINSKNEIVYSNEYDPTFKKVYIKIDAYALGDNIAWMPYVEEYRKKYNCDMICSTFHNHLFYTEYPEILFVEPNTVIKNLYSQFYIGAVTEINFKYSPVISTNVTLQKVASKTLGLDYVEVKPKIGYRDLPKKDYGGKYVCISEFGSSTDKSWKYAGGWQLIVDYLNENGFKVVVISKEPTQLNNVINKTGPIELKDRISDIEGAEFYIGVSSGLAWLSWAVGTHVVMISDVTPWWHEFKSGISRITANQDLNNVDYSTTLVTTPNLVIEVINELINKKS